MDGTVPTAAKRGMSGVDIVGYLAILSGTATLVLAGWAWGSPAIADSLRGTAVLRSLLFTALAVAYGLALLQRGKVALRRGWCLLPLLGAGLTPIALIGVGLVFWFTHHLRTQPNAFAIDRSSPQ